MNDLSPSNRFQYLDRPLRHPGTCCVCGNPNRPVVDFGTNLHQRNSVWVLYICVLCIKDAYEVVDIATGDKERRESEASRSLANQLNEKNLVAMTREQYDDILDISNHFGALADGLASIDLSEEPETESIVTDSGGGESSDFDFEFVRDDSKSTEPISSIAF